MWFAYFPPGPSITMFRFFFYTARSEEQGHTKTMRRIEMNSSFQFKQRDFLFLCPKLPARKGNTPKPIQDPTSNQKLCTSIGGVSNFFCPLTIPLKVAVSKANLGFNTLWRQKETFSRLVPSTCEQENTQSAQPL